MLQFGRLCWYRLKDPATGKILLWDRMSQPSANRRNSIYQSAGKRYRWEIDGIGPPPSLPAADSRANHQSV